MILSTKKNHQQSKKTYHNKEYVKSSGSLSIHWCSIKKSKSEFAKFKNEKNIQKSSLPVTYISSHHFQKRKKNVQQIAPSTFEKKAKHTSLKKERFQKKYLHISIFVFFCLFFLSNHHTTKQKYFLVSCRNKKLVVKTKQIPLFVLPSSFLFLEICFDRLLFLSSPPFLFWEKKKYLPFFAIKEYF